MGKSDKLDTDEFREKRARERVEDLKMAIARGIGRIENPLDMFKYECSENKWNDEVAFQIEEGITKLGMALATLCTWYDEEDASEKKSNE